jgi:hypothetical protein
VGSLRSVIFYKIDRIPYFDIRYSLFDIRYSLFQSFFSDQTGRFSGQRRRSYETTPKWHGFLMINLAASMAWIKQRTAEYPLSNDE